MSLSTSTTYNLLDGNWPILDVAHPIPVQVVDAIKDEVDITSKISFLSLGYFFIDVDLLEQHDVQRPIVATHIEELGKRFKKVGVLHTKYPGVVIGLGNGWYNMKNSGPNPYYISKSCPHLHLLSSSPQGHIGQIIRGGHRTEAIRLYSRSQGTHNVQENFWCYNVLVPGTPFIYTYPTAVQTIIINYKDTGHLPRALLLRYSCTDDMDKNCLANSYHRVTLTCVEIADFVYRSHFLTTDAIIKIRDIVNHLLNERSRIKIHSFLLILEFKRVVPHLLRLLRAGGVWTLNCEQAYAALLKCHVEQVIVFFVTACADQAELINKSLKSDKAYNIYDLLPGGESDFVKPDLIKAFADGSPESLSNIISSPELFETISSILLKGKYVFDTVFLSPIITQEETSIVGDFFEKMKCTYCLIILFFLGPGGLDEAIQCGNQSTDDLFIVYLDRLLIQRWKSDRVKHSTIKDSNDVSQFIFRQIAKHLWELESDGGQWLETIPIQMGDHTHDDARSNLQSLVNNSDCWMSLVKVINDRIMSIHPIFQSCCPVPPNPFPTAPILPSPALSESCSIDSTDLEPPPPGQPRQDNHSIEAKIISIEQDEEDLEPPPPGQPCQYNRNIALNVSSIEADEDDYYVFSSDDDSHLSHFPASPRFTSTENAHMLAAIAKLSEGDRETLRVVSEEELVENLQEMIQNIKKTMKRKNIKYSLSPTLKRTRY